MSHDHALHAGHSHSEADGGGEEWLLLAWLSGACLLFTILGLLSDYLHAAEWVSLIFYSSAYLSGGWDAAGDAWARIRKGELDIHF
jgi:Cd2+/Zn2+-exporting ATPase